MSTFGVGLPGLLEQVEMAVDAQAVAEVVKLLGECVEEIEADPVEPVPADAFGNGSAAVDLGHHTGLARETVVEALTDVIAGLNVYAANCDAYRKDALAADEVVSTSIAPIQAGVDCAGGGFADQNRVEAPQCVAPGGSES